MAVDAIKRVNAIVSDSDMYARETIRIPDSTKMGQIEISVERGDSNSNSERPRIRPGKEARSGRGPEKAEKAERPLDFFSKFDASVRDNAERARNTLGRLRRLGEGEGSDTEGDYEIIGGEGMSELRKWNA